VRWARAQALLELALCAPVLVLLALGVTAVVQVEDAAAGLEAATSAAASAASHAPDSSTAEAVARARFAAVLAAYPLHDAVLQLALGSFSRSSDIVVTADAFADVAWAGLVLPHQFHLRSRAVMRVELWRTHRAVG
jgi:Flp pilus assembly protein TadG